jgi:ribonuclease J
MRVRIHRGAQEVGGNCIEVESAGARIVLDVGRPLDALQDGSYLCQPCQGWTESIQRS